MNHENHNDKLSEKKLSRNDIYEGSIVHLVVDKVLLPNGTTSKREVILHNGEPLEETPAYLTSLSYLVNRAFRTCGYDTKKAKESAIEITTKIAIIFSFLAGGIIIAKNIP